MPTSTTQILTFLFQTNHEIIHMQLKDITQAQSLLQPPFRGNCMNYDIGHILAAYDWCLQEMGLPGTCSEAEAKVYGHGSEPLTDAVNASDLNTMVKRLDESLEKIVSRLGTITEAELERQIKLFDEPWPLIKGLYFMHWHITYHSGQLELLRQLAGKNDKIM
jgi:hypothetical protein